MALKAYITALGHAPKVNTRWPYSVHVTLDGKAAPAKITAEIIDPVGGVHPVEFGKTTRKIINVPFKGVFKDFIIWPPESRGIPLTLHCKLTVGRVAKAVDFHVTPR